MEQLKHIFNNLMQTVHRISNSLHDLGRNSNLDWFVVCVVATSIVFAGLLIGAVEYRKVVSVVSDSTPLHISTTTKSFDFTQAKRTLDAFEQKEFIRQDVIQGKRDIPEFAR